VKSEIVKIELQRALFEKSWKYWLGVWITESNLLSAEHTDHTQVFINRVPNHSLLSTENDIFDEMRLICCIGSCILFEHLYNQFENRNFSCRETPWGWKDRAMETTYVILCFCVYIHLSLLLYFTISSVVYFIRWYCILLSNMLEKLTVKPCIIKSAVKLCIIYSASDIVESLAERRTIPPQLFNCWNYVPLFVIISVSA
jgi:hypothetical protein